MVGDDGEGGADAPIHAADRSGSPDRSRIFDQRETAITRAAERVSPAVVTVSVKSVELVAASPYGNTRDEMLNRFLRQFSPPRLYRQESANMGSGVILDKDGYIVTSGHVVESAETIEVVLGDGRRFPAKLISTDP